MCIRDRIMGVSPAITAGAAVSGAMLGDKTAKISDTALLTVASVGGVSLDDHAKMVLLSLIHISEPTRPY